MVVELFWALLKFRLSSSPGLWSSRCPTPLALLTLPRIPIGIIGDPSETICNSIFPPSSSSPCGSMFWGCGAGTAHGFPEIHPMDFHGLRGASRDPWEGHSRGLAKPLCFLLVRLRDPSSVGEGHSQSGLFVFKSVLTAWLTKEGSPKARDGNPSLPLAVLRGKGTGRGQETQKQELGADLEP